MPTPTLRIDRGKKCGHHFKHMPALYSSCGFLGFGKKREENAGLCGPGTKLSDDGVCVVSLPKLTSFVQIEQVLSMTDTCEFKKDLPWCSDLPQTEEGLMEKFDPVMLDRHTEINDIRREYYDPFCGSYPVDQCNTSKCKLEKGKCVFDESKLPKYM